MLPEQQTSLIALDRKLMLARFELAIEALTPLAPELAATPPPTELRQRPLEEWIETAEHLIATGVHERYPEHARRHARALKLILSNSNPEIGEDISLVKQRVRRFLGSEVVHELIDLGDGLRLRPTRRADRHQVEDWSAIDGLATMTGEEVQQLNSGHPYRLAICAYRLGFFEQCREALGRCLDEDPDVEEYWSLLAFTERHLGRRDVFERIVFKHEREWPA